MKIYLGVVLVAVACGRHVRPDGAEFIDEGQASYYGPGLHGRKTASGETFDKGKLTAAHRTMKFGTCVEVENLDNRKRVRVRINDRGPFSGNRVIDVSEAAGRELDMIQKGVAHVRLWTC